ncbi:MAG: GGDEF domain-containing protein [Roseburia sp.]|nr:GGDEF domain-containing protein [Ruminococcus sp.]MCM1155524.1 GGDEF domain-containing protein [Roseburia sp.]MCM1241783.1 GGDEF domain-containing protein [Roseburia sp.]
MEYKAVPFEKRIKENIKNYAMENLYPVDSLRVHLKALAAITGAELLLTDRHGEKVVSVGNFAGFTPDVVGEPGKKIRVCNRTIAHLYVRLQGVAEEKKQEVENMLEAEVKMFSCLGEEAYRHREYAIYMDELEEKLGERHVQTAEGEKEDALTGVFHKFYFDERMKVIDRSEVVPVAVINANINDWKYVNDNFGDEESDRLIKTIAGILKNEAKPDYIIGRVDGDVFIILIPMADEGEAEDYCERVQAACLTFEDGIIAPSVACGIVYKTNVEEELAAKLPDAEYEMFNNKFEIKNAPGYRERLEKRK